MDDVKHIEDDLVSKENKLEKRVDDDFKDQDNFGSDSIEMHPLIPHFPPPKDLSGSLRDIRDRVHDSVMDLRKEIFGEQDETTSDD